jgi:copper chaperone NosL
MQTAQPYGSRDNGRITLSNQPKTAATFERASLSLGQVLLLLGVALFAVSHFFIWWELRLNAPQFPGGLFVQATSYEIQDSPKTPFNDIDQVDGLNHYIGMMSLGDAAKVEMSLAVPAIIVFTVMGFMAAFWERKWAPLLAIPIVIFPWVYFADLFYWLRYAGHNLDPTAAITIDSFTPVIWGRGVIAQFSTDAGFSGGWYLAVVAGISCLVGMFLAIKRERNS